MGFLVVAFMCVFLLGWLCVNASNRLYLTSCMFVLLMFVAMPPTTPRGGRHSHGSGRGIGEAAPEVAPVNMDMDAVLAEMQAMRAELNALRQGPELGAAANGPVPVAPSGVATGGGEPVVAPQRPLELRDWCGMSLEKFTGTGAPIKAGDWLSAVIDKLVSFQVSASDWVCYAH